MVLTIGRQEDILDDNVLENEQPWNLVSADRGYIIVARNGCFSTDMYHTRYKNI